MSFELPESLRGLKVTLVHEWLVGQGGGERVAYDLHVMFPDAPIYTLVHDEETAPDWCRSADVRTTFLQRVPGAKSHHKMFLTLMPRAWEALDLTAYDLVVSSCNCCCKGVVTRPDATHVCYCHTPTRYLWDMYYEYLAGTDPVRRLAMRQAVHGLRQWDYLAAQRVDAFIANSDYVGRRIRKYYRRDSVTVHPATPIRARSVREAEGYYLVVSRFVHYKRVDIAIEACNRLGRRLVVVGSGGEEEGRLRELAGPAVEFMGRVSDRELEGLYAGADALLFPGIEDFGLTPVEAMASGVPVLAYGEGGALETVLDGETGLLFHEQTAGSLADCMRRLEAGAVGLSREEIAGRTMERFSTERFMGEMAGVLEQQVQGDRDYKRGLVV